MDLIAENSEFAQWRKFEIEFLKNEKQKGDKNNIY